MEGNDYKIRTMARDLEEARKVSSASPSAPFRESIPEQVSDKTAEVRKMDIAKPAEERKLEEILHEARKRIEVAPKPRELADLLPIEEKSFDAVYPERSRGAQDKPASPLVESAPPLNLPTAESKSETPEEILGLPTKPIEARRAAPVATRLVTPLKVQKRFRGLPFDAAQGKPTLKFALLAGSLSVILIAVSVGMYVTLFAGEPSLPAPLPQPEIIEQPLPKARFRYDEVRPISLSELSYDVLKPAIDALEGEDFKAGSMLYIPVKYASEKEIRYLTAAEFFGILQIDFPPLLASSEDFSLFLYAQEETARLGFVLTVLDAEAAESVMKEWEKTIVEDLGPFMFGEAKREEGAGPEPVEGAEFKLGSYKDLETHFINLPAPSTSVDWILAGTHLIVATSKDAARAAVDRLLIQ